MLQRARANDGLVTYRSGLLTRLGVPHLFTTRRGPGGADLDLKGLGLGPHPSEARLLAELGSGTRARLVRARQVHGAAVVEAGRDAPERPPQADGLVSSDPARAVLVFSADCVPILVSRADGGRVAAVHAGWRGLVAGVLPRALEVLREQGAADGSSDLVAVIGPCLSLARFEVGPEVAEAFRSAELGEAVREGSEGRRPHIDLRRAAVLQLVRGEVSGLEVDPRCTWDDPELYSYRRDVTHGSRDHTGRLAAIIAPR